MSGERTTTASMPALVDGAGQLLGDLLALLDDGRILLARVRTADRAGREAAHEAAHEGVGLRARELLRLGPA